MAGQGNAYEQEAWELPDGLRRPGGADLTIRLLDAAGLPAGARALDIGCGAGDTAALLAARGVQAFGIDASPVLVRRAREAVPQAAFEACEFPCALPWPGGFDAAVAQCALSEVALCCGLDAAVAAVAGLLAPGGLLVVSDVFDRKGPGNGTPPTYDEWMATLDSYRFDRVYTEDCTGLLADFAVALVLAGKAPAAGDPAWCPALAGMEPRDVGYFACVARKRG